MADISGVLNFSNIHVGHVTCGPEYLFLLLCRLEFLFSGERRLEFLFFFAMSTWCLVACPDAAFKEQKRKNQKSDKYTLPVLFA